MAYIFHFMQGCEIEEKFLEDPSLFIYRKADVRLSQADIPREVLSDNTNHSSSGDTLLNNIEDEIDDDMREQGIDPERT